VWIGWPLEAAAAFAADGREPDVTAVAAQPAGRPVRSFVSRAAVAVGGRVQLLAHRELRRFEWNLGNYATILGERTYLTFLGRSLLMALAVALVCLVYAWPCAYLIARHGGRYRLVLVLLTAAPFLTGILLRIAAMQQILGPIGLLNMALQTFGLQPIEALMYTNVASAIGLVYLWIPFMLVAIYLSLLNFDFQLLEVAKVCGARPWQAFWLITWPLNWMGTAIGIVLVVIPTLAATVTPRFLGGPNGALYGNILEHQFGATGTWALGSAMGVVLFAVASGIGLTDRNLSRADTGALDDDGRGQSSARATIGVQALLPACSTSCFPIGYIAYRH
jgi:ABC-type spermidine/putrescine transport system permease subunit I